jgi:hypothetical protein
MQDLGGWGYDWLWGVPLTVLTLVLHVSALALLNRVVVSAARSPSFKWHPLLRATVLISAAVLISVCIHAMAAGIWAFAYVQLGALDNAHDAMLYSMEAQTSYGHTPIMLSTRWHMLGALEALVGVMMAGLTVAFLFLTMQQVMRRND